MDFCFKIILFYGELAYLKFNQCHDMNEYNLSYFEYGLQEVINEILLFSSFIAIKVIEDQKIPL